MLRFLGNHRVSALVLPGVRFLRLNFFIYQYTSQVVTMMFLFLQKSDAVSPRVPGRVLRAPRCGPVARLPLEQTGSAAECVCVPRSLGTPAGVSASQMPSDLAGRAEHD